MRAEESQVGKALSAHGGLFYKLQLRLGLLKQDSLRSGRRAAIFVALAWGIPLLMSLVAGRANGTLAERPFLLDPIVWARFVIAIALFTVAEERIEEQLGQMLRQFIKAPLLAPTSFKAAAAAVAKGLKRRDSHAAEVICIILAVALSVLSLIHLLSSGTESWAVRISPAGASLTAAGWWCLLFSSPLFFFLLLRGLWRHLVWTMLLRQFAAMKLRLVATHPDGKAGLAFVGRYPNVFVSFVFGLSCVVGASLAHQLLHETVSLTAYGYVMGLWLVIVLACFAHPLLAFSRPLVELKQKTLLLTGAKGTQFERQAERKLFGSNVAAPDPAEAEGEQDIASPAKQFEASRKMSTILIERSAILPVCAAALLPLVAAGATQMPYKELLNVCKKLLLL